MKYYNRNETVSRLKSNVIHKSLYPKVSIVDPELMVSLPAKQTAYTGMDTFCHAFENLIAVNANHFSRMFSIEAIKLVACSIRRAVNNGEDLEARAMLALASTYGGIANANGGGTTLVHDIGIPLSVYYNIPHGASLTVTLSEIIRYKQFCQTQDHALLRPVCTREELEMWCQDAEYYGFA